MRARPTVFAIARALACVAVAAAAACDTAGRTGVGGGDGAESSVEVEVEVEVEVASEVEVEVEVEAESEVESESESEVEVESEVESDVEVEVESDVEVEVESDVAASDTTPPRCNAGDPCPLGALPDCFEGRCTAVGSCIATPIAGCCSIDADCAGLAATAPSVCDLPRCISDRCALTPIPGCCAADAACDDGVVATVDLCLVDVARCRHCAPPCPLESPLWTADFEGPIGRAGLLDAGFTLDDAAPNDAVGWSIVAGPRWASGAQAAYLGDPRCGTYDGRTHDAACQPSGAPARVQAALTTPPLALPADRPTRLAFWVWTDVEPLLRRADAEPDVLRVRLLPSGGSPSWELWSALDLGKSTGGWRLVALDLAPWRGQTVQVRFAFDTFDGLRNTQGGVWIDGLELRATCSENSCCTNDFDCAAPSACDSSRCLPLGDGATRACVRATRTPNLACAACADPAACDDGDACTADSCEAGACTHTAFCCLEAAALDSDFGTDLDGGLEGGLAGWHPDDRAPDDGVSWQLDDHAAWFGNPLTRDYTTLPPARAAAAALVSPTVQLPTTLPDPAIADARLTLELTLRLATEWDDATPDPSAYENPLGLDRALVTVHDGAFATPVWSSDALAGTTHGEWTTVVVDLSAWRGRAISVSLAFDSGDAAANTYDGLRLQHARIGVRCH